jgi:cytochrome c553
VASLRLFCLATFGSLMALFSADCPAAEVRFDSKIRPIFAEYCLECHGRDANKREADLRLDGEGVTKIHAIVTGRPAESELVRRITTDDPDERMPPAATGKRLRADEIALVRQWILEGAKYEGHWAYEAIRRPEPAQHHVASTEIDFFVVQALEERGLSMSPAVTRQQLIRRATFDLIGLPPTWKEVEEFVNDDSPDAFARVVDRLLDSPRYGERWGRHWLDIARYADTHGGGAIGFRSFPFSYTYRDYVIRAFNTDLPYDRFVTEQLAADQLGLVENDPASAALGFLTIGMQFRNPHDLIDDQIDVVSRGLLGLTVACARCHDHKYDAVPTEDYYSLYATLASSRKPQLLPVIGEPRETEEYREYQQELARLQARHDAMAREQIEVMRGRFRMQVGMYLGLLARGTAEQDASTIFLSYRTDDYRPRMLERWRKYLAELTDDDAVFGPWRRLARSDPEGFADRCGELVKSLVEENGDPATWSKMKDLAAKAPRWNPRVLDALAAKKPQSLVEVAKVYGELFSEVHQQWLRVLIDTSLEARSSDSVVPDQDPAHTDVNSPINRQLRNHLYALDTPTVMSEKLAVTLLNRTVRDSLNGRRSAIHTLHLKSPGSPPRAMAVREDKHADEFYVFRRGSSIDRGQPVEARFLTVLSAADARPFPAGERRLGLARAIVDPANPLTRRVIVNWVWRHHLGRGLVRTPDDFGVRGRPPTHPGLLDYLATTFLEDGWSLKKLHRRILLTEVYQQASIENAEARDRDPENNFLWRMPRRRLELEAMRDAMLAASGELDTGMGGRPFGPLTDSKIMRRSVYAFVNRDVVSNFASIFDSANASACTASRSETTVPQQTLFALNSSFIQDRAAALAARKEIAAAETSEERVRLLYRRAFSRSPEPSELELALQYAQAHGGESKTNIWQRLAHALLAANEFVFVD